MMPLNWPDSGHAFSYTGLQPADTGKYPTDIMASPTPAPDPTKSISLLSASTSGNLASITDLGKCLGPGPAKLLVTYPGGALPDIPSLATLVPKAAEDIRLQLAVRNFRRLIKMGGGPGNYSTSFRLTPVPTPTLLTQLGVLT